MTTNKLGLLEIQDEGRHDADALLFIHGYPDDLSLWDGQVSAFASQYRCVRVTLPGFGDEANRRGYDFSEVVAMIHESLMALTPKVESVTLVTHDWGAIYGYMFLQQYPHLVRKMAALDVGAHIFPQKNPLGYVLIPAYQLTLASAYVLSELPAAGRPLSMALTGAVRFLFQTLNGQDNLAGPSRRSAFHPIQNYPYYYFWRNMLLNRESMRLRTPTVPFFYAYGEAGMKRYMSFQSQNWLKKLQGRPDCVVYPMPDAGHWLMRDKKDQLNKALREFFVGPGRKRPGRSRNSNRTSVQNA